MDKSLNEKQEKIKKISIYYVIILILSLLIMVVGLSLAYYTAVASQKEDATKIHTGTLVINFTDGINIKNPLLIPRSNPSSINDTDYLYTNTFKVESTGTLDQTLDVYLNITKNEFSEGSLKYKVYNSSGKQMKEGIITKSGDTRILENTYLAAQDTGEFTLMIWLQETGIGQNEEQAKSLIGTMKAEATQVKR